MGVLLVVVEKGNCVRGKDSLLFVKVFAVVGALAGAAIEFFC